MIRPSLRLERELWNRGLLLVAGVDEVGIGCLSGPVVASAVVISPPCRRVRGVMDSKLLSPAQREVLAGRILRCAERVALGAATVSEIERLNVLGAARLAMRRALARLGPFDHALIDGRPSREFADFPHTAVIDGDARCYAIACASIVAKVARDSLMRRLAARFPQYGWEHNAGYPTPQHLAALRQHGPTPLHRRTFAPVRALLDARAGL